MLNFSSLRPRLDLIPAVKNQVDGVLFVLVHFTVVNIILQEFYGAAKDKSIYTAQ